MSQGPLRRISRISDATSHRISSYDRSGGNADFVAIAPGETFSLANISGAGVITHIWITLHSEDPLARRNLILRMYWDGQDHPSVEAPLGDFFGQGWGMKYEWQSLPLAATPVDGNSLVCYFPMPFGNGARIEVTSESDEPVKHFYYYVDFERHDSMPDTEGRFHAWYHQERTSPDSDFGDVENEWELFGEFSKNPSDTKNYLFCEPDGNGHFVGVNYYINNPTPVWYGEGDDMFLVDGEPWPGSAHGTGTEDYFNQSWCPDTLYMHPYFGTARAPGKGNDAIHCGWLGRTHVYRFHLEDPIRFKKSLRASIEHGHANCLSLDLASVAYWYQTLPSKPFPPLPNKALRAPLDEIKSVDIHRWRDAWRQQRGGGFQWGNERS